MARIKGVGVEGVGQDKGGENNKGGRKQNIKRGRG